MLIPNSRALSTKPFWLILHFSMSLHLNTVLVDKLISPFSQLMMNRCKIVWITVFILCFPFSNFFWLISYLPQQIFSLLFRGGGVCHYVFFGHLYPKTLCEYICEVSVKKEAVSQDVVIKGIGKKELGMVSCIVKKLGFSSPSSKPTSTP